MQTVDRRAQDLIIGWSAEETITLDIAAKEVVAELKIQEGTEVRFDRKFV